MPAIGRSSGTMTTRLLGQLLGWLLVLSVAACSGSQSTGPPTPGTGDADGPGPSAPVDTRGAGATPETVEPDANPAPDPNAGPTSGPDAEPDAEPDAKPDAKPDAGAVQAAKNARDILLPLDPNVPVAMPLDRFLGRSRRRIERLLRPTAGVDIGNGWVRYGKSFALKYERRCAVELAVAMPAGTSCTGPLSGIGFGKRGPPLRRRNICLWPADSVRHPLGKGLSGSLDLRNGMFHAQLVGKARRCRR